MRRVWGLNPLHVLLCPLITRLSLKQMTDHRPVAIRKQLYERVLKKKGLVSLESMNSKWEK